MKKLSFLFTGALMASMIFISSCGDDDNGTVSPPEMLTNDPRTGDPLIFLSSNITADRTFSKDTVYVLSGRIAVEAGATLTIQAGTIIKGEAGTGPNATALLIARDAKIIADGTATEPIIFTTYTSELSISQIASGDFVDPKLSPEFNGLWGGLIVLGNAPISASAAEVQIEGIPTSDTNGLYGGDNPADSSGIIRYVSIRHGGANIGAGNEINGLSLGGVGSGTVIENIEIVGNQDDGIEWFGGNVNVSNALVWNCNDDGLDTDQGWSGTCSNFIIVTVGGHNFELDGPEGSTLLDVQHTLENGTVVHASIDSDDEILRSAQDIINTDDNSGAILRNIFITAIPSGVKTNDVTYDNVDFENVVLDVHPANLSDYIGASTIPVGISAGSTGNKADVSVFSWTWAGQSGSLAGL